MTSTPEPGLPDAERTLDRPEFQGGAGLIEEGAPIGFTADVGGAPATTDSPDELDDSGRSAADARAEEQREARG